MFSRKDASLPWKIVSASVDQQQFFIFEDLQLLCGTKDATLTFDNITSNYGNYAIEGSGVIEYTSRWNRDREIMYYGVYVVLFTIIAVLYSKGCYNYCMYGNARGVDQPRPGPSVSKGPQSQSPVPSLSSLDSDSEHPEPGVPPCCWCNRPVCCQRTADIQSAAGKVSDELKRMKQNRQRARTPDVATWTSATTESVD